MGAGRTMGGQGKPLPGRLPGAKDVCAHVPLRLNPSGRGGTYSGESVWLASKLRRTCRGGGGTWEGGAWDSSEPRSEMSAGQSTTPQASVHTFQTGSISQSKTSRPLTAEGPRPSNSPALTYCVALGKFLSLS